MTESELDLQTGKQITLIVLESKMFEDALRDIKAIAFAYANQFKVKSDKWDSLDTKIANCYVDKEGNELSEEESEDIDLSTIGEVAASAFGYL